MTRATSTPPARVILLGMMGGGKSSVGRALAKLTGWPFVDNDELVERATGRTARALLAEEGEGALRAAESAALREGLAISPPAIVATAAGTILDAADRERIARGGFVVWLTAPADTLAERATGGRHRPWLDEDPSAWFRAAVEERRPLYASVADLEIDTAVATPPEAARAIVERLLAGG